MEIPLLTYLLTYNIVYCASQFVDNSDIDLIENRRQQRQGVFDQKDGLLSPQRSYCKLPMAFTRAFKGRQRKSM